MKTLGQKISEQRKNKKMTQDELANLIGVSAQAVSKWENDISIPDLPILVQLSDIFHISLDNLIREDSKEVAALVPEEERQDFNKMILRIIIRSADGDKVKVNLPMPLVKMALEMGTDITQLSGNSSMKEIDIQQVMMLVEQGVIGKIVEIESEDGDLIEIVVE